MKSVPDNNNGPFETIDYHIFIIFIIKFGVWLVIQNLVCIADPWKVFSVMKVNGKSM